MNVSSKVPRSFKPDDPNADLAGPEACIYFTKMEHKFGTIIFDAQIWNTESFTSIKNGCISQNRIKFFSSISNGRKIEYEGLFSSTDKSYVITACYKTASGFILPRFSLKNQKLTFDSVTKEPSKPDSPSFFYKQETFASALAENPDLRISQIKDLISNNWKNLNKSVKAVYEFVYEEQIERYKESWISPFGQPLLRKRISELNAANCNDKLAPDVKRFRPNRQNLILTQIHKIVSYRMEFLARNGKYQKKQLDWYNKKNWGHHACWVIAIDKVKDEYRKHMEFYNGKKRNYDEENPFYYDGGGDGYEDEQLDEARYFDNGQTFEAVMVDLENSDVFEVPISRLSSDLQERATNVPQKKRYLIAQILRDKDFDPQTIKGVLDFACHKEQNLLRKEEKPLKKATVKAEKKLIVID